jgi:hypothetical protein
MYWTVIAADIPVTINKMAEIRAKIIPDHKTPELDRAIEAGVKDKKVNNRRRLAVYSSLSFEW